MPRILLTSGPNDWRKLLADPEKHSRSGYSACTQRIAGIVKTRHQLVTKTSHFGPFWGLHNTERQSRQRV